MHCRDELLAERSVLSHALGVCLHSLEALLAEGDFLPDASRVCMHSLEALLAEGKAAVEETNRERKLGQTAGGRKLIDR